MSRATTALEVILTHEHTDFDALASLLGASFLYPDAIPVLPRRLNRNVHSFLALYKNHFPIVSHMDVPQGTVKRAILVDARAVNWVRGMDKTTKLHIIDHHTDSDTPLPENATLHSEAVGANTTLLVESLMGRASAAGAGEPVELSPVQATLLALGIHEDTGSLTYSSTTYRDAQCLAWLLAPERGVNLEVLGRFLNHPLSQAQRDLLESLIEQSQFHEIAGHPIVIAHARAEGFNDELSALVGRLRNHHEADAIFMVVQLNDVIQVVARSLTDDIDVGKVARALGGGGHTRAAAAPVDDEAGLENVVRRILQEAKRYSSPAVTIAQIMSAGRPQSLPPDLSVQEAAVLMRRYGHEGFPVIRQHEDGPEEVLGVLTRRDADRAISHKLGHQPVSRFMRAGNVTIPATASIHELRQLMTESNWGQIPVVDEEGRIQGIVTRTDLIKLWDEASLPTRRAPEIAQKLQAALTVQDFALLRLIGAEVETLHFSVYVVGGFVRDLLLNHTDKPLTVLDLDIVIEGDAIAFARRLEDKYGGRVVPHQRFNTAKWILDDDGAPVRSARLAKDLDLAFQTAPAPNGGSDLDDLDPTVGAAPLGLPAHLDFVSARTEFYAAPTALPTVEESSIKLDLHRRDFTVNTLAICINPSRWGELLDFWGGMRDLEHGTIRALHSVSFVDDPTRILRAVRYEQRFGFEIETYTLESLHNAVELLRRVTPARVRHEFERIFQEKVPERVFQRLDELQILQAIHPALAFQADTAQSMAAVRAAYQAPRARPELTAMPLADLYWGVVAWSLSSAEQTALIRRLGLQGSTRQLLYGLSTLRAHESDLLEPDLQPSQAAAVLDQVPPAVPALVEQLPNLHPALRHILSTYLDHWRHVQPEVDGHALRGLGIPSGPIYRTILTALRNARLDGQVRTRAGEEAMALRIAKSAQE